VTGNLLDGWRAREYGRSRLGAPLRVYLPDGDRPIAGLVTAAQHGEEAVTALLARRLMERVPGHATAWAVVPVVNPDGLRNQAEGGIVQSASWTLHEKVVFDDTRIRSVDWSTYPILRFDAVPESVEVHIIDRPGQPYLGSGEAAQGPTAASIGNAVANATGVRLRDLPLARPA